MCTCVYIYIYRYHIYIHICLLSRLTHLHSYSDILHGWTQVNVLMSIDYVVILLFYMYVFFSFAFLLHLKSINL